jgi:hypothetical protein
MTSIFEYFFAPYFNIGTLARAINCKSTATFVRNNSLANCRNAVTFFRPAPNCDGGTPIITRSISERGKFNEVAYEPNGVN